MSGAALDPAIVESALPHSRELRRMGLTALAACMLGAAGCVVGAVLDPARLLQSYLIAYLYWLSIALGCLGIQMVSHVSPGAWSLVLRRILESASRTVPLLAVLFIPLLAGVGLLYPFATHASGEGDAHGQKAFYLNVPFWVMRAILYFIVWAALAGLLSGMSRAQDGGGGETLAGKMSKVSALGLCLFVLTVTFASVDWVMALEPEYYSTIHGLYVIAGQAVAGLSFSILVAGYFAAHPRDIALFGPAHFHDAGKMLLAFVMIWAYFGFSQFLIIWAGDLPEEIHYYEARIHGGMGAISIALALLHFAVPFALLLPRTSKRDRRRLAAVALLLLVMRWVDVYWLVAPAFRPQRASVHWLDVAAFLAIGGAWLFLFFRMLARRPIVPLGAPLLAGALEHGADNGR